MAMKLSVIFDGKNQKLKQATKDSESALQGLQTTALRVTGVIAAAYSTATSAQALLENQKMVDRWNAQMRVAAGGTEEARAKMGDLNQMADETGTKIGELILGYTRLSNLGLKPSEEALLSYMNTSQAMSKSLEQFIEAVADASVAEFERLKEFGIKARNEGETIKFTFQGVTTEVANHASAIQDYLISLGENQFAGIVDEQATQVEAALNRMDNQWIKTLKTINDGGIGNAMKATIEAGTEALAGFTTFIEEEGETIVDVGKAIAAVFAARILGATTAATHGFMLHQIAQARVIARYAAMNGISRSAATGLIAVGTAARFASAGMAMLGGPIGVIALAAYALYEWNTSTETAEERTARLSDEVDKLANKYNKLGEAGARIEFAKITQELGMVSAELTQAIAEEEAAIKARDAAVERGLVFAIEEQRVAVEAIGRTRELTKQKEELERQEIAAAKALNGFADAAKASDDVMADAGDGSDKAAEQFAKVADKLSMQIIELAMNKDEWERYQIMQEAGTALTDEQIQGLDQLIARIRQLREEKERDLEVERQRQAVTSGVGDLSNQLMPEQSEIWQHRINMSYIDQAIEDPTLAETMPGESEVEKLARLNALKELEMQRHSEAMAAISGDMTSQIDAMWSETFDRFAAGIGDAVATSIMEGQNFGEMMQNLAKNALKTIISSLVEIGVKKLMLAGIEKAAILTTNSVALTSGTATAAGLAAAYTPAAAAASLASAGVNAPPAMSGMTAAMALAGSLFAGIAHNGIGRVPASHEGTWLLRRDEMVLNPKQRENFEFLVDHLKAQRPGAVAAASGGGSSGGMKFEFYQEFKFEGGAGGNREEVEQAVTAANERFKAELIDDFSSGGRIYQTLRAKGG